jgi:hypothetical protein
MSCTGTMPLRFCYGIPNRTSGRLHWIQNYFLYFIKYLPHRKEFVECFWSCNYINSLHMRQHCVRRAVIDKNRIAVKHLQTEPKSNSCEAFESRSTISLIEILSVLGI